MNDSSQYLIRKTHPGDTLPSDLLLLADPDPRLIATYLPLSQIYLLTIQQQPQGICLLQITDTTAEVMNLASESLGPGISIKRVKSARGMV